MRVFGGPSSYHMRSCRRACTSCTSCSHAAMQPAPLHLESPVHARARRNHHKNLLVFPPCSLTKKIELNAAARAALLLALPWAVGFGCMRLGTNPMQAGRRHRGLDRSVAWPLRLKLSVAEAHNALSSLTYSTVQQYSTVLYCTVTLAATNEYDERKNRPALGSVRPRSSLGNRWPTIPRPSFHPAEPVPPRTP